MSSLPLNNRNSNAAWSKEDDVRLCRLFVLVTEYGEGTEHVKKINKELFVHELAALTAEDLDAAPRAVGQCRSTGRHLFILKQPFLMSFLVIVGVWHESCRLG